MSCVPKINIYRISRICHLVVLVAYFEGNGSTKWTKLRTRSPYNSLIKQIAQKQPLSTNDCIGSVFYKQQLKSNKRLFFYAEMSFRILFDEKLHQKKTISKIQIHPIFVMTADLTTLVIIRKSYEYRLHNTYHILPSLGLSFQI